MDRRILFSIVFTESLASFVKLSVSRILKHFSEYLFIMITAVPRNYSKDFFFDFTVPIVTLCIISSLIFLL